MVQISAIALFLIGVAVGIVAGIFGMTVLALNYKGDKDGKNKKE